MTAMRQPPTVLVVDDDDATRQAMRELLHEDGYRVVVVPSVDTALTALAAFRFALILTDTLDAPFDDLERHAARLRERAGGTPVVLFSAHPERAFAGYERRGFAAVIAKPFDLDTLSATVRRVLAPGSAPQH
jgi:DNA-binding NtrC family response regulator